MDFGVGIAGIRRYDPQSTIYPLSPLRVAIDARSLGERNTSNRTYWSELVTALGQRPGIELLLVSNVPVPSEDIPTNAEAVVVPTPGRWFSLVTLPKVARERGADVAHVQYSVSPLFGLPVVTTIHDVSFLIEPSWFGAKDRFLLGRTVPAACRRAARALAVSETCREEILAFIDVPPDKVVVTLEGTPNRLLGLVPDESTIQGIVQGRPYALLVGGASPRKNLRTAIEAVGRARWVISDLVLLVTGCLPQSPAESWVLAPGPLDEPALAAAYRGAHALLHPSLHEGFGLTILEAMALECPVVASDRGAIPEVAGSDALLYDAFDVEGLADGVVRLLNPAVRDDLVERGRRRAASFTWLETATKTEEAYGGAVAAWKAA